MSIFNSFDINASGLTAQRYRMDVISENIANVNTTRTADGTYKGQGVKVTGTFEDTETDLIKAYEPDHPDADEDGYVYYPNVNIITEMTDLIDASRSYEANATAFSTSKAMAVKGLEMAN